MEPNFSVEDIKSRIYKDSNGISNYSNVYINEMDWLIEQAGLLQKIIKELDERIYSANCADDYDVVFELENLKLFIKENQQ